MYLVCYKGDSIFDSLIRIMTEDTYTHVGLALGEPESNNITYYASREDNGVAEYTEPLSDVDLYKLNNPRDKHTLEYFNETKGTKGSLIADCGYRWLKDKEAIGTTEWCAKALDLGFPHKYTIEDLIEFANITL